MVERSTLRTARLLLRPLRAQDVDDLLAYRNDAEFARYLPHIPQPFTRDDAATLVAQTERESWDTSPTFAIERDGRVVGTVNFEVDLAHQIAMLGYAIGRAHWGAGIGFEAARAALAWAFETYGLARVWATADARNTRSRRLLERLGMQHEGTLRSHERARDGRTDKVYYGVLREEWVLQGAAST